MKQCKFLTNICTPELLVVLRDRSHITNMMILEFTVCNTASAWIHDEESFEISPIVTPGAPLEVP